MTEQDKHDKFKDLAVKRMNQFIKKSRLLANLGNESNYKAETHEKKQIVETCQAEVDNIKKALYEGKAITDGFSFDEPKTEVKTLRD